MNFRLSIKPIILLLIISIGFSACDRNLEEDLTKTSAKDIRAAKRAIGVSAREILSAGQFESMEVELQYMVGFEPNATLVESLRTFLQELVHKPGGIEIKLTAIAPLNKGTYTLQDIRAIEDANRNAYNVGKKLGLYFLFLDGYSSEDSNNNFTYALVHRNTSVAMFSKRIRERTDRIGQPSRTLVENTVSRHELGHLMGLVNVGSAMEHDHEDPNQPGHCDNRNCLMFWAVETGNIFNVLDEGTIPSLDQNCRRDLQANGGK